MEQNEKYAELDKSIGKEVMKEFKGKETEHKCRACGGSGTVSHLEDLGSGACECSGKCQECDGSGIIRYEW